MTCVGILCSYGSIHVHVIQIRLRCSAYVEGPQLHRTFPNMPPSGNYKKVLSVRIRVQFSRVQEPFEMHSLSELIIRGLQRQQSWAFCVHRRTRIAPEPCWRIYPSLWQLENSPGLSSVMALIWHCDDVEGDMCSNWEFIGKDDVLLLVFLGSYSLFWYCFRDHTPVESHNSRLPENWGLLHWRKFYRQMTLPFGHVSIVIGLWLHGVHYPCEVHADENACV